MSELVTLNVDNIALALRWASDRKSAMELLTVAAFREALTSGLRARLEARRASWPANSEEYLAWKKRKGMGQTTWAMTGATERAITGNAMERLGKKNGMKLGLNRASGVAFIQARSFVDAAGKKLPAARAFEVSRALNKGSVIAKAKGYAAASGRDVREVGREFGLTMSDREIPARPLFGWEPGWMEAMEEDLDAAVVAILRREGIDARTT